MMSSMFAGISGLRAHQSKMDVIGNNIANVNTIGFRASRVTFQEVFSQTIKGASSPDPFIGRGGTNPMQVGLGTNLGAIDTITNRGSLQRTDNITDISIDGEGFFIVKGSQLDSFKFTRAGNFTIDRFGNLVTPSGMNVYGWLDYGGKMDNSGVYNFDVSKPVEPINIYTDQYNNNKRVVAAKSTSNILLSGNLDATNSVIGVDEDAQFIVPMIVHDSLGNEYEVTMEFRKTAVSAGVSSTWTWSMGSGDLESQATGTITFDSFGEIVNADGNTPVVTFQPADHVGSSSFDVVMNLNNLTMYSGIDSSVKPINSDGYSSGKLVSYNIGSDGIIMGIYSNGKQQPLGMIGLAEFDNPAGLMKTGENMYITTPNSGDFRNGVKSGSGSAGVLNPGTLEMSNVDLANQFADMIITQRGFQGNSRIMTTVDEMLQELANMKR